MGKTFVRPLETSLGTMREIVVSITPERPWVLFDSPAGLEYVKVVNEKHMFMRTLGWLAHALGLTFSVSAVHEPDEEGRGDIVGIRVWFFGDICPEKLTRVKENMAESAAGIEAAERALIDAQRALIDPQRALIEAQEEINLQALLVPQNRWRASSR
jgi:hypothetical protein